MTRLIVIDNYDSFTWNLVQHAAEAGADTMVFRNDAITVAAVLAARPDAILISPGPCSPREAGISVPLIREAAGRVPILGVCLGHQAIAEAYGGTVERGAVPMHGKTTAVAHCGEGLFEGLPSPLRVMRYHSLTVSAESLPCELEVTASPADPVRRHEIMALRHRLHPVFGVQFHPESVGTEHGHALLANFLAIAVAARPAGNLVRHHASTT